jgi:predicted enzyme related to lactoylglutathione lyase
MYGRTTVSNIGVAMFTVADQDAALGVETADVRAEHERLSAIDGVTITTPPMEMGGAPTMFSIADPDGNHIWIVQTSPPN